MTNAAAKIVQAVVTVAFGVIPATIMLLLASAMMLVGFSRSVNLSGSGFSLSFQVWC